MAYNFITDNSHKFLVGDQPTIYGNVSGNKRTLEGVTVLLTLTRNILQREKAVDVDSKKYFNLILDPFLVPDSGSVIVAALESDNQSASLNGSITDTDTSLTLSSISGALRSSGWLKIGSEWMSYTLTGSTAAVTRGVFGTTPASHSALDAVRFADSKTSLAPFYDWKVYDPAQLPQGVPFA